MISLAACMHENILVVIIYVIKVVFAVDLLKTGNKTL
jgi:hypothetical protein